MTVEEQILNQETNKLRIKIKNAEKKMFQLHNVYTATRLDYYFEDFKKQQTKINNLTIKLADLLKA